MICEQSEQLICLAKCLEHEMKGMNTFKRVGGQLRKERCLECWHYAETRKLGREQLQLLAKM